MFLTSSWHEPNPILSISSPWNTTTLTYYVGGRITSSSISTSSDSIYVTFASCHVFNLYWHLHIVHRWPHLKSELNAMKAFKECADKGKCNCQCDENILKYLMGNADVDMSKDAFHLEHSRNRNFGNLEKYLVLEPLFKRFCRNLSNGLDCITAFVPEENLKANCKYSAHCNYWFRNICFRLNKWMQITNFSNVCVEFLCAFYTKSNVFKAKLSAY